MPLRYRVGNVDNTSQAAHWVREEFGVDANLLGHLTPQIVRQMSLDSKEMQKQIQLAKVFCKEAKSIMSGKVKIEKLRKELLEHGLASKEEVDEVVKQMILLTEKHKGHIAKMLQELSQGKALIHARVNSDLSLSKSAFQNKLRELRARHNAKSKDQQDDHGEALQNITRDRQLAKENRLNARRFTDYITGIDQFHKRYEIGAGRRPPSLISKTPVGRQGGLLSRLFG